MNNQERIGRLEKITVFLLLICVMFMFTIMALWRNINFILDTIIDIENQIIGLHNIDAGIFENMSGILNNIDSIIKILQ